MASTYSPNLRLELIGTGEQQGTWGSTTNTNLGTLLEEAIGGYTSVTVTDGADTTLTTVNGGVDQSRNMVINLTGTLTATRNVICPAIEKLYVVKNATSGGFAVTFKVGGQTGVSVPNGSTVFLYVDGTDARSITSSMASQASNNVSITGGSITGITDLAIADGGTGASDAATARTNLGLGTIATQNANAVSITGGSIVANASSLSVRDADASNTLTIAVGSNLTANTTLTLTTGATANRTLDISASNVTISTAGAALIDDADAAAQRTTLGLGSLATLNTVGTTQIDNNSVTGAKIALGSDAQGDVMYYDGTDWVRLAAGTSGQYLKTNGAGANPAWASVSSSGIVRIASSVGIADNNSITFSSISAYSSLLISINGSSTATSSRNMWVKVSSDNGATQGALRTITSSATAGSGVTLPLGGWVLISNTGSAGTSKTITPSTIHGGNTFSTVATESVITGVINSIEISGNGGSVYYAVTLYGIP